MAEYISRAAAERAAHMAFVRGHDAMQYATMIHLIAKIPAADVRENTIRTQADRIRAMSDAELAEFVANMVDHDWCCDSGCMIKHAGMCGYAEKGCDESALNWLQSPADGGGGDG